MKAIFGFFVLAGLLAGPLDLSHYLPGYAVVEGSLKGKSGYVFLLDTGAERTIVDAKLAKNLGLKEVPTSSPNKVATPSGGSVKVGLVATDSFGFESLADGRPALVMDLTEAKKLIGGPIDMIIGFDVLRSMGSKLRIDYKNRRVSMEEHAADWGQVVKFEGTKFPIVDAVANGRPVRLLLDTGSHDVILFGDNYDFGILATEISAIGNSDGRSVSTQKALLDIKMGEAVFKLKTVSLMPKQTRYAVAVDGILGTGAFGAVELDFLAKEIRIAN